MFRSLHIVLLFCLLASGMNTAFAATVQLPQSGQTLCYDTNGNVITCSGTGQDGAKMTGAPWPNPRFSDNGDGTLTDNLTGLIWLKNANCTDKVGGVVGDYLLWDDALTWSNSLASGSCGLSDGSHAGDWRLPNINELRSLVNSGFNEETCSGVPCVGVYDWLNAQSFSNVQPYYYWSSTSYAGYGVYAWYVIMSDGSVDVSMGDKTTNYYNVWPVRGQSGSFGNLVIPQSGQTLCYDTSDDVITCSGTGQDGRRWRVLRGPFTNNGDGTVTDNLTGLIWLKNAECTGTLGGVVNIGFLTWANALTWSNSLVSGACGLSDGSHAGDWRLPNREELESLFDFGFVNPAVSNTAGTGQWSPDTPFDNVQSGGDYWSSTTDASNTPNAWYVYAYEGVMGSDAKSVTFYVWPVRGGQSGPFANLTISKSGAGTGTVASNPAGIYCGILYSPCSMQFTLNQVVTLAATPATGGSIFSGWSGDPGCTAGIVTMSADEACTATFNLCAATSIAMTGSSALYGSITAAYVGASSTDVIKVIASNQQENLVFSSKNITLQGGYDCAFSEPPTSFTTITGSLIISGGSLSIGEGEIRIQSL